MKIKFWQILFLAMSLFVVIRILLLNLSTNDCIQLTGVILIVIGTVIIIITYVDNTIFDSNEEKP